MDRGEQFVNGVAVASVLGALLAFLVAPAYTVFPLLAFFGVVTYGWKAHQANTAKLLMFLMTASTIVILGLITVYLILRSIPVFQAMGLDIVLKTSQPLWSTSQGIYSLVPMMWGTLVTTLLAMAIAAPLGVAGALFISEIAPGWAREVIKPGIEILAGVPSIVYGFIGYVIINTYMMEEFELANFGSLFAAGLVIGVMALPTVVSVAEDAIDSVPESMKSGSLALGATDWQTIKSVTIPASFSGVSAAVLLGVGRAVGETMAVTVMLPHQQVLPDPLYDVFKGTETLTSVIAGQYGVASGNQMSALFAAGVVLFVTVLGLSIASQLVEAHMERKLGGSQ
ncbi:phosphate ABC transporter permease subunit PstC [Halorussus limi]|uniref:Phosphate transport system permease protein n=1 Tax=Halorussus limi TaxID=2938695 RepID=A0A8U0I0D7_9EURY|nr:phosphate ABC transporter permease subunit PstC [Halorussus limi]UPV76274.1 phosphate ABC transporter permease subunit PstC [Halorussus limi]